MYNNENNIIFKGNGDAGDASSILQYVFHKKIVIHITMAFTDN